MSLESYLHLQPFPTDPAPAGPQGSDQALESLIHRKSGILNRKLEILATEMMWRLRIAAKNVASLDDERARLAVMIQRLDHAALYQLLVPQDRGVIDRAWIATDAQQRTEEVECWRDVVQVMRDFLVAWEAHQLAQSRAIFLDHVGG